MNLSPVLRQRFLDSNGAPLNGGKLYSYVAGTTTPQATYSDSTGTTNANPVVLDSQGYADVWLDPTLTYKFVLKDSGGSQQWSVDNVTASATGLTTWNANTVYSQGSIVADSSGYGLLYVSLSDNNSNHALTDASYWRVFGGHVRTLTADTTLVVTDNLIRSNSTSASLTMTLPTAATTPIGKWITVADIGSGGNTTTCNSLAITNGFSATFENNGTTWDNIAAYGISATSQIGSKVVTAAKIADATITTTQIATANITQALLAARATGSSVAAGGVATSSSSGAGTTINGGSYGDVSPFSVTITTTGRPVYVGFIPDGTGNDQTGYSAPASSGFAYMQILRGATVVGNFAYGPTTAFAFNPPGTLNMVDFPAAGTYTYKLQAKVTASNVGFQYMKMIAYEL